MEAMSNKPRNFLGVVKMGRSQVTGTEVIEKPMEGKMKGLK